MAILLGVPILIILTVLQSVVVNDLTLLDGRPDLILLAVIGWGISGKASDSMVLALIGGLSLDLLSNLPLGLTAINLILIAYVMSLFEGRFWESHILMPMGVMLIGSLAYHMINMIIIWLLGNKLDFGIAMTRIILPSSFLNILLALPFAQMAKSLSQKIYPPEVKI